jgi:hypothetical protein
MRNIAMKYLAAPLLLGALAASLLILNAANAEDDDDRPRTADVIAVTNPVYEKECGSCHMAYSPGLLPARSWTAMMSKLNDHFGDNAELDNATQTAILSYLTMNSADHSGYRRSQKIMRSLDSSLNGMATPLRISELPYIKRKHHELRPNVFKTHPDLTSLSQCSACHSQAAKGSFSEREINIPGMGRWED